MSTAFQTVTIPLKKVCVFVPLSRRVSRGDQIENARFVSDNNFGCVLQEEELINACQDRLGRSYEDCSDLFSAGYAIDEEVRLHHRS